MFKRILVLLSALMLLCTGASADPEWLWKSSPPTEVREHIASHWGDYAIEDYVLMENAPDGNDYGFALLTREEKRMLLGYRMEDGEMRYWLRTEAAMPQGVGICWMNRQYEYEDGELFEDGGKLYEGEEDLAFSVQVIFDTGKDAMVAYRWRDGGFKLSAYKTRDLKLKARVGEGFIDFYPFHDFLQVQPTRVYGSMQTDLRYASYNTWPQSVEEAREKLSIAPSGLVVGTFEPKTIEFTGGQKYPVYSGPGETYARSGNGKGMVSTNGWIQVFGTYEGYAMIQYAIDAQRFRIGWIDAQALPSGADVPSLTFDNTPQLIMEDCTLTDDPISSETEILRLAAGTQVISLADFGEHFYIELELNGEVIWGFVPADAISKG